MDLLDLTYQNGYDNAERRNRYMEHLIQRFEEMTADARRNGHVDVVAVYESLLQQWRRVPRELASESYCRSQRRSTKK